MEAPNRVNATPRVEPGSPQVHPLGPSCPGPGGKVEGDRLPIGGRWGPTASAASNASTAKKLMLPDGSMLEVPEGLAAKIDKRGGVVYHVVDKEAAVRLVAQLLLRVSRGYKGVVYLNSRKLVAILGLRGRLDVFSVSMLYGFLTMLGFEITRTNKGVVVMVNTKHPLIEEIRNAENVNDVIKILKTRLGG
jgi:hypothetical protein